MAGALALARRRKRFAVGGAAEDEPYEGLDWTPGAGAPTASDENYDEATPREVLNAPFPQGALSAAAPISSNQQLARINAAGQTLQQQVANDQILRASGAIPPAVLSPGMVGAPTGGAPMMGMPSGGPSGQYGVPLDPSQAPGAVNLPLLAAAGAMLEPTRSGTFSESLGKAFQAAVPVAEQQRALAENAAMRKAQQDMLAQWHGGQLAVNQDKAQTYAAMGQARLAQADAALARANNPHATTGDIINSAVNDLVQNQNWSKADAYQYVTGIQARSAAATANAAANTTRAGAAAENADTGQTRATDANTNAQARNALTEKHYEWMAANAPNAQVGQLARVIYEKGVETDPYTGAHKITVTPQQALQQANDSYKPPAGPRASSAPAAPQGPAVPAWVRPGDQYSPSMGKARDAAGNIYGPS